MRSKRRTEAILSRVQQMALAQLGLSEATTQAIERLASEVELLQGRVKVLREREYQARFRLNTIEATQRRHGRGAADIKARIDAAASALGGDTAQ